MVAGDRLFPSDKENKAHKVHAEQEQVSVPYSISCLKYIKNCGFSSSRSQRQPRIAKRIDSTQAFSRQDLSQMSLDSSSLWNQISVHSNHQHVENKKRAQSPNRKWAKG